MQAGTETAWSGHHGVSVHHCGSQHTHTGDVEGGGSRIHMHAWLLVRGLRKSSAFSSVYLTGRIDRSVIRLVPRGYRHNVCMGSLAGKTWVCLGLSETCGRPVTFRLASLACSECS